MPDVPILFQYDGMEFDRDNLVFRAICVLDEIVDQCHAGTVKTTLAVRFILAFLYSQSKSDDRSSFDKFWKIIRDEYQPAYSDRDSSQPAPAP